MSIWLSTQLYAQLLTGRVTDSETGMAVSYASIGLVRTNKGTTANQDGRFKLDVPSNLITDTLVISSVGYKAVKLPVENSRSSYEVQLTKNEPAMREVTIRRYLRKITLPWNRGRADYTISTLGLTSQVARLLLAPEAFSRIESVSVATGHGGLFGQGQDARFRIRIYDYDSTFNKPGVELCDSVIEVSGRGIVTVKLDKYQIVIPRKRFFVAVQWLFIDENREMVMKTDGKTYSNYIYKPGIRMARVTDGGGNSWWQYHNGQWIKSHDEAAITATVFY